MSASGNRRKNGDFVTFGDGSVELFQEADVLVVDVHVP